jgi:hypothetical protein
MTRFPGSWYFFGRPVRCLEGRLWRHDPQIDDPDLETDVGACPDCQGAGCDDREDDR